MFRQLFLAAVLLAAPVALAQEPDAPTPEEIEAAYQAAAADILKDVAPDHGDISLSRAPVTLRVPDTIDYYDGSESRVILEDLWGNPPDDTVLGMLFPAGGSPATAVWGAVITYEDTGYVSDSDAAQMDFDDMLRDMQASTRQSNPERERLGYGTVELVGWAKPPHYDPDGHRLEWAKDLIFSSAGGEHTVNYDMRVLGRGGVLSINFVAPVEAVDEIRAVAPQILAIPSFNEGSRYADYKPGDKTAGYGVAALIAGGVGVAAAKKVGLLGIGLLFLKKGWVLVLALFGALGGWFRRMFGGGAKQ